MNRAQHFLSKQFCKIYTRRLKHSNQIESKTFYETHRTQNNHFTSFSNPNFARREQIFSNLSPLSSIRHFNLNLSLVNACGKNELVSLKSRFSTSVQSENGDNNNKNDSKSCSSCGLQFSKSHLFLCPSCGSIQPEDPSINFFDLLNIEKKFDIDVPVLEANYKSLQKILHPDKHAIKSDEEKSNSLSQSARVINAYFTLLRPLSRARYMLQLQGVSTVAEENESTIHDQNLLMEIMEIRESIEDAEDENELKTIRKHNEIKLKECEEEINDAFGKEDWEEATHLVRRMSYYKRISEEMNERIE